MFPLQINISRKNKVILHTDTTYIPDIGVVGSSVLSSIDTNTKLSKHPCAIVSVIRVVLSVLSTTTKKILKHCPCLYAVKSKISNKTKSILRSMRKVCLEGKGVRNFFSHFFSVFWHLWPHRYKCPQRVNLHQCRLFLKKVRNGN